MIGGDLVFDEAADRGPERLVFGRKEIAIFHQGTPKMIVGYGCLIV
jgi:hypothetical protein